MRSIVLVILAAVLVVSGCRKKPDPVDPTVTNSGGLNTGDGHMEILFENVVGSQPLVLNTQTYTNEVGNSFTVSKYNYYISNIKLWRADSSFYLEPESYHLIREDLFDTKAFTIHGVPQGTYTHITFTIGVDSARNVSGAQTGALDPNNAMYWGWITGYIMAKLEGTSPVAPGGFAMHLGGFSGSYNVLRTIKIPMPSPAIVNSLSAPEIHIESDVLEWFKTPYTIDIASKPNIMDPGKDASNIATNYTDMFTVTHVEN